jgi:6-pyruvoyl-tetrahydropterin synthase
MKIIIEYILTKIQDLDYFQLIFEFDKLSINKSNKQEYHQCTEIEMIEIMCFKRIQEVLNCYSKHLTSESTKDYILHYTVRNFKSDTFINELNKELSKYKIKLVEESGI